MGTTVDSHNETYAPVTENVTGGDSSAQNQTVQSLTALVGKQSDDLTQAMKSMESQSADFEYNLSSMANSFAGTMASMFSSLAGAMSTQAFFASTHGPAAMPMPMPMQMFESSDCDG